MRDINYVETIYSLIEDKQRLQRVVEKKNADICGLLEYIRGLKNLLWQNEVLDPDELNEMEELLDFADYGKILP